MKNFTLNCSGKLLDVSSPKIMAILNCTPDSFYDGGKYVNENQLIEQVKQMLQDGADIIDIGGMSTRPNATIISEMEELDRVLPVVQLLHQHFPNVILSIDTSRSVVAKEAVKNGVSIINDVSAGTEDETIFSVAAQYCCPIVLMHRIGNAQTMQQHTHYQDIIIDVFDYFIDRIKIAKQYGVTDLIIDIGFGFSKTLEQNYYLLQHLSYFEQLPYPILSGLSRKSMLYKLLDITAEQALNATSIVNTIALQNGTSILRVHDVKEAKECVKIYNALNPE